MSLVIFIAESLLFGFFLWFGLYILTRDFSLRQNEILQCFRPAVLCGLGTILFAGFILGVAMQTVSKTTSDYILWQRATWWTVPIGCWLYTGAVWLLYARLRTNSYPALLTTRFFLLALVGVVVAGGTITNLFIRYENISIGSGFFETFNVPFRFPHYYAYALYVLGTIVGSAILLIHGTVKAREISHTVFAKWYWLGIGGGLIMFGGAVSVLGFAVMNRVVPEQLGDLIIAVGVAAVGYGIVKHNALEHDLAIRRDFEYSLLRATITALGYNIIFWSMIWTFGYEAPLVVIPLLFMLAIFSHTPLDWQWELADRLLLPNWLIGFRRELSQLQVDLIATSLPEPSLEFAGQQVHRAIKKAQQTQLKNMIYHEISTIFQYSRFHDDDLLEKSHLGSLLVVQNLPVTSADTNRSQIDTSIELSSSQRIRLFLQKCIQSQLSRLFEDRSANSISTSALSSDQIAFLLLEKKYAENMSRKEVERYIATHFGVDVTGGTYTRHIKIGRKRLAEIIYRTEIDYGVQKG